jgi:hypothetical protein
MECEFTVSDYYGMAGIGSAREANNHVALLRENINYLSLAFISPLETGNTTIHLLSFLVSVQQKAVTDTSPLRLYHILRKNAFYTNFFDVTKDEVSLFSL